MDKDQYIPSLDGLRGFAAFAVVLSHMGLLLGHSLPWLMVGDEAVALFFALSGFLMAMLYGGKTFTAKAAGGYLLHRFARIYPIYFIAVAFVVLLSALPGLDYIQPISGTVQIVRHFAMIGSTGVFWSIPPEIQFYLFFLLLWLCFDNPAGRQILVITLLCGFAIVLFLGFPGPGILLPSKIPYFLFGALAGRLFLGKRLPLGHGVSGPATLVLLVLFFLSRNLYPTGAPFWGVPSALIATIIVYLAACEAPLSKAVLTSTPLRFAGRISFSLYLFHMPVGFLVVTALPTSVPPLVAAALMVAAAITVATATHYAIERPARRRVLGLWKGLPAHGAAIAGAGSLSKG